MGCSSAIRQLCWNLQWVHKAEAELASKAHLAAVVHVFVVEVVVICRVHSGLAQLCHISQAYWRNSQHGILCRARRLRGKGPHAHTNLNLQSVSQTSLVPLMFQPRTRLHHHISCLCSLDHD